MFTHTWKIVTCGRQLNVAVYSSVSQTFLWEITVCARPWDRCWDGMVPETHQGPVWKLRRPGSRPGPRGQWSRLHCNATEGFRCCGQGPGTSWNTAFSSLDPSSNHRLCREEKPCSGQWAAEGLLTCSAHTGHKNFAYNCHSQDSRGLDTCGRNY